MIYEEHTALTGLITFHGTEGCRLVTTADTKTNPLTIARQRDPIHHHNARRFVVFAALHDRELGKNTQSWKTDDQLRRRVYTQLYQVRLERLAENIVLNKSAG